MSSASSWTGSPPAAASSFGSAEPRPIASITRSPTSRSPASVRTAVTCTRPSIAAGLERGHADAAADLDARLALGGPRDDPLERAAPPGPGDEALVAGARRAVRDRSRQRLRDRVEAVRAGRLEGLEHVGELGLEHRAPERLQVVRLAELDHAVAAPALPGRLGVVAGPATGRARGRSPAGRRGPASSRRSGRRGLRRARSCGTSLRTRRRLSPIYSRMSTVYGARARDHEQERAVRPERNDRPSSGSTTERAPARGQAEQDACAGDRRLVDRRPSGHVARADAVGGERPEAPVDEVPSALPFTTPGSAQRAAVAASRRPRPRTAAGRRRRAA